MNKLSSSGKVAVMFGRAASFRTHRNRESACRGRSITLNFARDTSMGVVIRYLAKRLVAMLPTFYCCPAGALGSTGLRANCFAISFSLLF